MNRIRCGWCASITAITLLLLGLALAPPARAQGDPRLAGYPGETPIASGCFEQWIGYYNAKMNAFDGTAAFNGRKPWFISPQYGVLHGKKLTSNGAPDEFHLPPFSNVRNRWIWWNWGPANVEIFRYPNPFAGIMDVQAFVTDCVAKATPPSVPATAPTVTGGTAPPVTGGTTPVSPPTTPIGTGGPDIPDGTTAFTIIAAKRVVKEGDLVTVPIYIVNTPDMANINFEIAYDGAVAKTEGDVAKGAFPSGFLFAANPGAVGNVLVGLLGKGGVSAPGGPVAQIPFRAVGKAGQETPLTITVTKVDGTGGSALTIARINGLIKIVDANGRLPGGCFGNLDLTTADAECALRMSVELRPVDLIMDMDKDGQVTSRDATIILQRVKV